MATGKHVIVIGGGDTGLGLRGHVEPARRRVDHAVRAAAAAAGGGEQAARVAELADQAAHVVVARGRLRARLGGDDQALRGPRRQGREARGRARRMAARRQRRDEDGRDPGQRVRAEGRPRAVRDGLRRAGAVRAARPARRRARRPLQREGRYRQLPHVGAQGLRGRRRAPRAVAGGLGDPRGPPGRARRRRVPDGDRARCRASGRAAVRYDPGSPGGRCRSPGRLRPPSGFAGAAP